MFVHFTFIEHFASNVNIQLTAKYFDCLVHTRVDLYDPSLLCALHLSRIEQTVYMCLFINYISLQYLKALCGYIICVV